MKKIAILGATGSVGSQAIEVARSKKEEIQIVCMTAKTNYEDLAKYANEFKPKYLVLADDSKLEALKKLICYDAYVLGGKQALITACADSGADIVVLAILGIAGLPAFYQCLKQGITVALANKESLVCGADVTKKLIEQTKTKVLPVDSEHCAIFQCLGNSYDTKEVNQIWLTASGGPFLKSTKEEIYNAPLEMALKHPKWSMGKKITIDSATLANKGLEVIEAHYMYNLKAEQIKVIVHPQSIIHSMVEFKDSSLLAQLGPIDMRLPLQKAIFEEEMKEFTLSKPLDFYEIGNLELIKPDEDKFPCLALSYLAIKQNSTAVFNVANEEAVECYINGKIKMGNISEIIEESMVNFFGNVPKNIEEIFELDASVRRFIRAKYN